MIKKAALLKVCMTFQGIIFSTFCVFFKSLCVYVSELKFVSLLRVCIGYGWHM